MSILTTALLLLAGVAAGALVTMLAASGNEPIVLLAIVIYMIAVLGAITWQRLSRRAGVKREARRLGLSFSPNDPFRMLALDFHPFLRFGRLPGTQRVLNVVWGIRDGREVRAFEYSRPAGEDEPIRYSCAMMRIPEAWPSLLVRRRAALDTARDVVRLRPIAFELESFNRLFEVRATDHRWASTVVDQRMMAWLLDAEPAQGFQFLNGWLLAWMPRVPVTEIERVLGTVEGFHDRIPRAVRSLYDNSEPPISGDA